MEEGDSDEESDDDDEKDFEDSFKEFEEIFEGEHPFEAGEGRDFGEFRFDGFDGEDDAVLDDPCEESCDEEDDEGSGECGESDFDDAPEVSPDTDGIGGYSERFSEGEGHDIAK